MRTHQPCQGGDGLVPTPLRLVRIDRLGGYHFAGRIDHRDLHAGAVARVEAHGRSGAGGCGQQQVAQVGREHPHRLIIGGLLQAGSNVGGQTGQDARAPRSAHRVHQPTVSRPAAV